MLPYGAALTRLDAGTVGTGSGLQSRFKTIGGTVRFNHSSFGEIG